MALEYKRSTALPPRELRRHTISRGRPSQFLTWEKSHPAERPKMAPVVLHFNVSQTAIIYLKHLAQQWLCLQRRPGGPCTEYLSNKAPWRS